MSQSFRDWVEILIENYIVYVEMVCEDKLNVLDSDMFDVLIEVADWLGVWIDVWVVVLFGCGWMFCVGLDFMSFVVMVGEQVDCVLLFEE